MNMGLIFGTNDKKFRLKRAYNQLYEFINNNLNSNEYEKIVRGFEELYNIKQKHFILELYDPYYNGLESYCFSVYKDKTGYYTIYDNKIKHFHKYKNAIKYQCAKHIVNSKLSSERLTYMCLENSIIKSNESFRQYIDRSYSLRKRIFIN